MMHYFESPEKPLVLGLANSLFASGIEPSEMEAGMKKMEDLLDCSCETASSVVSVLRYNTQPHQVVLECGERPKCQLDEMIENEIFHALRFLDDHQFNPSEMYEGYVDEMDIPDPTCEPREILLELLHVYRTLGPWSADRAALVLLIHLEKLKVATPYERHFLILCMTFTVILKIRAILGDFFEDISDRDRIYKYTSPKILRLIEILRKFQPEKIQSDFDESSESDEDEAYRETSPETVQNFDSKETGAVGEIAFNSDDGESKSKESPDDAENQIRNSQCNGISSKESETVLKTEPKNLLTESTVEVVEENRVVADDGYRENGNSENDVHPVKNEEGVCERSVIDTLETKTNSKNQTDVEASDAFIKKSVEVVQRKNGIVIADQCVGVSKRRTTARGRSKRESANSIENYLPSHEYLLLPKFKVDKYTRYDRNSGFTNFKTIGQEDFLYRQIKNFEGDFQHLCGLIFVETKFTAKVLFQLLNDLKQCDDDFSFLSVQFAIGKLLDGSKDPKGAETEHRKHELVLKKFRTRECNVLIGTSFLEEGIDLPKCNLVIRFNVPQNYRSYVFSKERARATDSLFCLLINDTERDGFVQRLAEFIEIERLLLKKCMNLEPKDDEEKEADQYVQLIEPFCPLMKKNAAYVDLSTAIAHVNRYCAKLPSDTFTCLTPLWNVKAVKLYDREMYVCNIRLPINSPVKQEIRGCPMPSTVLARRFAAFQCCQLLHFEGELDDSLQPITKESFWMREEEQLTSGSEDWEEMVPKDSNEPRPGTTKRRQYYYKRIADSLTDCRPVAGKKSFLYDISMALTYPLPEEQNTRGRKIHAPEDSLQGFGILTCKTIPQIGAFPIFTRSGEVQVKLQLAQSSVLLSESQIDKIVDFIHYTFTSVLRLQRYLMMFDPTASENSYFIVPTKRDKVTSNVEVDWEFLELIYEKKNLLPTHVPDEVRRSFVFDPKKFEDAVIAPWYRNQDQPQYFYVAEICYNLSPKSSFPGTEYDTFEEYYLKKYDIQIQNYTQALLDVDHTSARLNFLTPRYVNRKGVALPTTSEEKKKAKRENLEQKQILVPELCNIHPFPGTLWRKAVCLPCILHRINALLLADQVRRIVANEIGVGIADLDADFKWKPLDFGWSLCDVLAQSKVAQQKRDEKDARKTVPSKKEYLTEVKEIGEFINELDEEEEWMIGTWNNNMAYCDEENCSDISDFNDGDMLPQNVTMIESSDINVNGVWDRNPSTEMVRYGSPTEWNHSEVNSGYSSDSFSDFSSDYYNSDTSADLESDSDCRGLKIKFKEDNVAEAVEDGTNDNIANAETTENDENDAWMYVKDEDYDSFRNNFEKSIIKNKEDILQNGMFYEKDKEFDFVRNIKTLNYNPNRDLNACEDDSPFGSSNNTFPQVVEKLTDDLKSRPLTGIIIKSLEEERRRKPEKVEPNGLVPEIDPTRIDEFDDLDTNFSFDEQPNLKNHPGPSPSLILQALTMSNANDGINLERLETIGDSFLKYAITAYLYCTYENVHEGKLSHLRSKQVSNYSLYRLGHKKVLGESMIATKFEPHDNWLPPCYYIPRELERALIKTGLPASHWNRADLPALRNLTDEEICQLVKEKGEQLGIVNSETGLAHGILPELNPENMPWFIPYNLMTQHSIPDKSIADCVEALIGAYLVACGPRGALLFMSWLGIKVLPKQTKYYKSEDEIPKERTVGATIPVKVTDGDEEVWQQVCYGTLRAPKPPLLRHVQDPEGELERLLRGFDAFEKSIKYRFRDRSYLLQALTHASYSPNKLTDCYQRLEFLGDAVLDYLITRHLYEDPRHHSPGALTDLRSALVNNTIFASLAVRHNFHKYFRHLCPGLNEVVDRFVRIQGERMGIRLMKSSI
ncbi:UNVERIFIED_CONTAM: hypothetical protein PYX00_003870 [Menopon gallinae]